MEFNISGSSNDQAEVDQQGVGIYYTNQIDNYYTCLEDPSLTYTPTFGIMFSGTELNYIQLSSGDSYAMRVSQYEPGNRFIIPITMTGCESILNKSEIVKSFGYLTQPFVSFIETLDYPIQMELSYPEIDIVGDFSKSGNFIISLEKNETQIIIRSI